MSASGSPRTLPAYLRLPDGVRLAGSAQVDAGGRLTFAPKQALATVPPSGLPVELVAAGLSDDEDAQVTISALVQSADARRVTLEAETALPDALVEALDPDSILWLPPQEEAQRLVEKMRQSGLDFLEAEMRRFLIDLGDHLFDLSTSSRYGMSGRHHHYDALNNLKRLSDTALSDFRQRIDDSLQRLTRDAEGQSFADLEKALARNLELVALNEMDQKLAIDKRVNRLIDTHRVELESLTIRCAFLNEIEPRKARTPFHPAHILQALVESLETVSAESDVIQDILAFFDQRFGKQLTTLYRSLNEIFIDAGVEPGLEEEIRNGGSLLNPEEKRIVKSVSRDRPRRTRDTQSDDEEQTPARTFDDDEAGTTGSPRSGTAGGRRRGDAAPEAEAHRQDEARGSPVSRGGDKHDVMYDAVISALDTQRQKQRTERGESADVDSGEALQRDQILDALRALQEKLPTASSLSALQPLGEMLQQAHGDNARLERESANQLSFIDTVFQTMQRNFEVSEDMAPSLARLRVPLARLSLREPRFFSQPDHPAHQLLDKLSTLASADHTLNRSLKNKVASIVDRIADEYDEDSAIFASAQEELDALLGKQDQARERNVERVIKALEGQERLRSAQRRVEDTLEQSLDPAATPGAVQQLLDSGWRSAMVQVAIREGIDSSAWREEVSLLQQLLADIGLAAEGPLDTAELSEMQQRLQALSRRINESNPGSVSHQLPLKAIAALLKGERQAAMTPYQPPAASAPAPAPQQVAHLPRLKRWLRRVAELEPGARLSYRGSDGRRKRMRLVWVSDDGNRFAFVNERGQKIAELSAVQLARQLSRGAKPPSAVDRMSVLDQSMYGALEAAQQTLSFERNRDQVTKLINGESLLYQLSRSVRHAQSRGAEHAFIVLNIDKFSLVNEVFDETSGNEVLSEFARLLGQLNDRRSLTARLEGDEFGILLTYRSMEEARDIAEKIRSDIAASAVQVGNEPVSFTVSLGIAPVLQETESAERVLADAQTALGTAKSQGGNQVVLYTPDQQEVLEYQRDREASRHRLDEAMSTDRLVLRAQPIVLTAVDGSEPATHHYEVLLSLRDDEGELQSPSDFITSAERFGYITLVDRWVIREVFTWVSSLMDRQKTIPELSINLSGSSVTDNDFLDYVLEQISQFGVGTSRLCFEITETGAIDNLPRAADFVRTLKNLGCKFSLDDFGTGLASHRYLKELPVDYVKIDGTFITNLHTDETDYAMAKSINDLAHFLGQRTVAECVESLDSLPSLREIGIDYLQGWGIGMPRRLSEVTEELSDLET
jgi:diguanylate cyclase (GGDEF)-like protein